MVPPFVSQVCGHLQQLGYTVNYLEEDSIFTLEHAEYWSFMIAPMGGGAMLRASFTTVPSAPRPALCALANELNSDAAVARFYADDQGGFNLEAWWPPVYDGQAFQSFVDAWQHDSALLAQNAQAGTLLG